MNEWLFVFVCDVVLCLWQGKGLPYPAGSPEVQLRALADLGELYCRVYWRGRVLGGHPGLPPPYGPEGQVQRRGGEKECNTPEVPLYSSVQKSYVPMHIVSSICVSTGWVLQKRQTESKKYQDFLIFLKKKWLKFCELVRKMQIWFQIAPPFIV